MDKALNNSLAVLTDGQSGSGATGLSITRLSRLKLDSMSFQTKHGTVDTWSPVWPAATLAFVGYTVLKKQNAVSK